MADRIGNHSTLRVIFETTGAWEEYSTPARGFRLLIAIVVVRSFSCRFVRRSGRYAMREGMSVEDVKRELQSVLASELPSHKLSYIRSDGSQWTLSLKNVIGRAMDFEMPTIRTIASITLRCPETRKTVKKGQHADGICPARPDVVEISHLVP